MTDAPAEHDGDKPSQAEGADPDHPDTATVLEADGRPSSAEGEDTDDTTEAHEVLEP